jgi:hypothetical protein
MSTLATETTPVLVSRVWFDEDMLHALLSDGREIAIPLEWYPRLREATPQQRENWRLIGRGIGVHWEDIDEDISVSGLLRH